MSNRYAPLPNPRNNINSHQELDAAFGDSDDEDDDINNTSESHPLNPARSSVSEPPLPTIHTPPAHTRLPGSYDFENVDYDYPPPGSPPGPSAVALPNDHGNSNGLVPSFSLDSISGPRRGWFNRTATAILPTYYVQRFGLGPARPAGPIGGGINNDGVFANVTAKPTAPRRIQDGDETYLVPEDTRAEAPPSYASAQADAVPPYWETTVHAPFSPDSIGEMIIDSLPTGSLFSFLWNMLVSISFQFVGFLLTYLLHTTHAARFGSRAGLGVTLIQYGFALRSKTDAIPRQETEPWGWKTPEENRTGDPIHRTMGMGFFDNSTMLPSPTSDMLSEEDTEALVADATTEWLSFFLMTVGWFILLTSLLGFWRVKRWERGIINSQRTDNPTPTTTSEGVPISQFERTFGLRGIPRSNFFRQSFGLSAPREGDSAAERAEAGEGDDDHDREWEPSTEEDLIVPIDPNDPNRERLIAEALERERRLQEDLRAAGLL